MRAYGGLRDDTSLVVVDITPGQLTFPEVHHMVTSKAIASIAAPRRSVGVASAGASSSGSSGGGGCLCFGGSAVVGGPAVVEPPFRTGRLADPSVRGGGSADPAGRPSAATRPVVEFLTSLDVAAVMGLMPDETPEPPGWYDADVGEHLFSLAVRVLVDVFIFSCLLASCLQGAGGLYVGGQAADVGEGWGASVGGA